MGIHSGAVGYQVSKAKAARRGLYRQKKLEAGERFEAVILAYAPRRMGGKEALKSHRDRPTVERACRQRGMRGMQHERYRIRIRA